MDMLDIIAKRRDGQTHTEEELRNLAKAAATQQVPDYQLAAWLMAAYLNPLSEQETAHLTKGMAESGDRIDLTGLPKPWVDKHSTGGVGDKTTLVLLPILAACGLTVVKMSGRGLGVTGGTVDKLGSIPGFRLDLSPDEMKKQAREIGIALTGQTPDLAPADKALYALRDATATVTSIPLIVSSILSKKIAGGAETVIFDVKCGSGAFVKTLEEARTLKSWLERIGTLAGLSTRANISDMDQPLGSAVGNALEVQEAIRVLRNEQLTTPVSRFKELCLHYAALTLEASGAAEDPASARAKAEEVVTSGAALAKAKQWFLAQGAPEAILDENQNILPTAPVRRIITSPADGWIESMDAETTGWTVVDLGGGRKRKEDSINPSVGIEVLKLVGDQVAKDEPILNIHAANDFDAETAEKQLDQAWRISTEPITPKPLFLPLV
jgi:pyrimidine-nucleoside phosphorylase